MAQLEDNIFNVLLKDKQSVLSDDHKIPFEQRKGKIYYKFHNVYGHWTNSFLTFQRYDPKSY